MGFQELFFHEKLRVILLDPNASQISVNLESTTLCLKRKKKKDVLGRVVGVISLLLRFFDNGLRISGFERGTLDGFILVA